MALVTANGHGVVVADFVLGISRAWHIDATIATVDPSQIDGKVTVSINDGQLVMQGTAKVEDVYLDTVRARIVAGAGGLATPAKPKAYQQVPVRTIIGDLLNTAGETLSSTADASALGTLLSSWTVTAMPVADAIGLVMDEIGASWRMLADGTMWCGQETWPDSGLTFTVEQADRAHQQLVVTLEAPLIMPGTALGLQNVSYVETRVDHKTVRSTVWLATPTSTDRLRDPMVAMVKSSLPQVDYFGRYRCKVVSQSGQSFDLKPDDPRLPADGFNNVPLYSGIPGLTVQVPPGSYLRIGWLGGDPSKPYCSMWEGGEPVTQVQLAGTHPMPLFDTFYADLVAWIGVLNTLLGTLVPVTGATGGPAYASAIALPTSFIVKMANLSNYLSQKVSNG